MLAQLRAPPAPPWLMTVSGWPRAFCRNGANARIVTSDPLPGSKPTISWTPLVGKFVAGLAAGAAVGWAAGAEVGWAAGAAALVGSAAAGAAGLVVGWA